MDGEREGENVRVRSRRGKVVEQGKRTEVRRKCEHENVTGRSQEDKGNVTKESRKGPGAYEESSQVNH